MIYKKILVSLCFLTLCGADERQKIAIASYRSYLLPSEETPYTYTLLGKHFNVKFYPDLDQYIRSFSDDVTLRKIICFDYSQESNLENLPKSKMVCFKWEPMKIDHHFYDFFDRVYTFDDSLVDNVKFFKFYYPVLQPIMTNTPSFADKNLCVMIARNWVPERVAFLQFFAKKPQGSLHAYGFLPFRYYCSEMNQGEIPGFHSGQEKLNILKNYKFCICFENTHTIPGYITEKIFDVFAAGCVPVYYGPENIEEYVPLDCFIDYRNFNDREELYQFMISMTDVEYAEYTKNIRDFLQSEKAQLFSQENFEKILYEAAIH